MIVEATANPGWKFVNWTENDEVVSSDPYYKFSVLGNRDLVANFELLTGLELETDEVLPDDYYISNAYPNPFNPSTNIKFGLPEASSVFVSIYNVNGQLVKNIYSDIILPGGNYTTSIKGDNLASGIYLYVFIANSQLSGKTFRKTEKLILLK